MRKTYELDRTHFLLLPALALGLVACNSDANVTESASESESESESESDSDSDSDSADPSGDPGPTTPTEEGTTATSTTDIPTPTTTDTTIDPDTTDTTVDPDTTATTVEPDTDTDTDTSTGDPPVEELVGVWGTANPPGVAADAIVGLTPALDALAPTLTIETDVLSIQSVAINPGNDAAITFDAPGGVGGVIIDENLAQNPMNGPLGLGDRVITGPATKLTTPKGVEWVGGMGLFLVADTGAASMLAFNINDTGDVDPTFEITDLGTSAAVWDMHYVGTTDTLYAAGTNGEVQVYEDFLVDMGAAGPARTIIPFENGEKVSVNLHGITVVNGRLYLSDVGDAMNAGDGQLFLIDNAADADGEVEVTQRVMGGMLGNPVDLEVRPGMLGERVFVAEKANKALLVFTRATPVSPLAQSSMLAVDAAESVSLVGNGNALFVARNAGTLDQDAALVVNAPAIGNPNVTATFDRLGSVTSVQSLALSHGGDAWIGFDGPPVSGGGGVFQVSGLTSMNDGVVSAVQSRLWGPNTGLVAPKGLTLNQGGDVLIVADFMGGDIKVFDSAATGDTPPAFVAEDLGAEVPWDVAYDDAQDRLFVAGTNGSVVVFDGFLADQGASPPARFIVPSYDGGNGDSVNLHGIWYHAATDTLLLSDVGDTMVADDGFLFVIAEASTADGVVEAVAAIGGDQTKLGNPVDIAFDGANLYVAEKSNSVVLRYDGVLDLQGLINEPEAAVIDVVNAESVQLFYALP